uniref:Uncharacterized protein n=1 Tax=Rhizophagus irregularis (strain DAOM 181602 / DAOM 197198 / MUCL 43194) TaxID=747089 RepID=U9TFV3_RHIID
MIMEKSSWIPGGSPNLYRFLSLVFIKVERQLCLIEFLVSIQSLKKHLFQQIF